MRIKGDFGRFLGALGVGLALTACGATAQQVGATYPANSAHSTSHAPAANAPPAADAAVSSPAAVPATVTPAPSATPSPSPSPSPLPAKPIHYGNPDGHAGIPVGGAAVNTRHPARYIGNGTPASCTSAAVVRAVAKGGIIDLQLRADAGDDHHDGHGQGREHSSAGPCSTAAAWSR